MLRWEVTVKYTTRNQVQILSLIDLLTKRHRVVHNGGFPKFEALY